MVSTTRYKGNRVNVGVSWEVDSSTITITAYPSRGGHGYSKHTKTWKNNCPFCKQYGILDCHGTGNTKKGWKFGDEGQIYCTKCGADFCGVTGEEARNPPRHTLVAGNSTTSKTVTDKTNSLQAKKEKIAKGKVDFKEDSKPKESFKLTVKANKLIKAGLYSYAKIGGGVLPDAPYFVENIDFDREDDTMSVSVANHVPTPSEEYNPPSEKASGYGSGEVKFSGGEGEKEKWLMNKGAELKTIDKIYAYIRKNGTYGMTYPNIYYNHIKGGDPYKFHEASAKYCLKVKRANCVDFAWLFWAMCKGAGIKVNIYNGNACFSGGVCYGHFWNEYNGKIYDCSATTGKNYRKSKTVI
nr:transglutaminase-like domain-containing protein [Methanobrevibacter arboriphilus]